MLEFLKKGVFEGTDDFLEKQKEKLILKTSNKTFDMPSLETVIDEIDKLSENAQRNYKEIISRKKTYYISLEYVGNSFIQATVSSATDDVIFHIEYMKDISENLVKFTDGISIQDTKELFKSFYESKSLSSKFEWEDMEI